jgi:uncharacterized membrane protein/osmotically-inducible protein OsmY
MLQNRGTIISGVALGAALMFLLDPSRGRRRRARLRDQMAHAVRVARDSAGKTSRDAAQRMRGLAARAHGLLRQKPVDDDVLVERVRAKLGRHVSHPHAVEVSASDGVVTLRGPILQHEQKPLLHAIERVPGVREVIDALEPHKQPGNIPSLQGGRRPAGSRPDVLQRCWSPATRLVAGSGGALLAAYGLTRRDVPGWLAGIAGLALVARAATNLDARRLTGVGAGRRAVDIQKTITIKAPVEKVFSFWTNYENFPRFMSHVRSVRPSSREGQSHWTVTGPAGLPVEFDAEVTALVPHETFGWRTLEGSPVAHAGLVRFERVGENQTRVHIRLSYNPPGGWIGHEIASIFGVDPKHSLDSDLVRMKTLIETGHPPRDAAQPGAAPAVGV